MAYGTFQPTSYNANPLFVGLASMGNDIGAAIEARKKADDEDKDFSARSRAAESFLETHAPDFGYSADQVKQALKTNKDETPRARYLRVTDTVNQATTGLTIKAHIQQQEAEKLRIEGLKRAAAQEAANNAALKAAANPQQFAVQQAIGQGSNFQDLPTADNLGPDAELAAYLGNAGNDVGHMNVLEHVAAARMRKKESATPQIYNLGNDAEGNPIQAVGTGNGNYQIINKQKPVAKPDTQMIDGVPLTHWGGQIFKGGRPLVTKPPVAPTIEDKMMDPELYDRKRQEYIDYFDGLKAAGLPTPAAKPAAAAPTAADAAPVAIASKAEFDSLKPGTLFNYNGKVGRKK